MRGFNDCAGPQLDFRNPSKKAATDLSLSLTRAGMAAKICPPFTLESAIAKVQAAEDGWNSCDPARCASAYAVDCEWRNRAEFFKGREAIIAFLTRKWEQELDYRLMKELWCYTGNRISVRFEYEWHDKAGQWYRTHGNEHWEYNDEGLMTRRDMSANDVRIAVHERRYFAPPK